MTPQSAKAKGKKLAVHIVKRLIEVFGLSESDIKSPPTSVAGEDLWLSEAARKILPFSFEAKNVKTLSLAAALEQAKSNANGYTPCVCHKMHGKGLDKTVISFNLEDFMKLWKDRNVSI